MRDDITLPPEDEQILTRLGEWLAQTRAAAEALEASHSNGSERGVSGGFNDAGPLDADASLSKAAAREADFDAPGPGLFKLVEEFTALRHDVKLQAKSTRGLQEQAESLLAGLSRSIEQFQSVRTREEEAVRDALRPVLEALVDLDVSFDRGRLAAEAARGRLLEDAPWSEVIAAQFAALPRWRRWWLGSLRESLTRAVQQSAAESWTATLNAQVDGYRLIQNRLRRLLAQQEVERLLTIGRAVDPNCMTVVDVSDEPSLPPGTVLEELRPGYCWRGQVLRYAEVRAVREPGATWPEEESWSDDEVAEEKEET
jgi:molecular chaperone GrpE